MGARKGNSQQNRNKAKKKTHCKHKGLSVGKVGEFNTHAVRVSEDYIQVANKDEKGLTSITFIGKWKSNNTEIPHHRGQNGCTQEKISHMPGGTTWGREPSCAAGDENDQSCLWEHSMEVLQHTQNRTPTRHSHTAPEYVPEGQHTVEMLGHVLKSAKCAISPNAHGQMEKM